MEKMFTRKETAEMLGMSLEQLDEARLGGRIAYIRYSDHGRVYFTESAIDEFVARCTHPVRPVANQMTYRKRRKPGRW